jgi:hypothetical protein
MKLQFIGKNQIRLGYINDGIFITKTEVVKGTERDLHPMYIQRLLIAPKYYGHLYTAEIHTSVLTKEN